MKFNDGGIYIFSEPIQTGKTTLLTQWIASETNIGGILTPDINGQRVLYDIGAGLLKPFQLANSEDGIPIGQFVFDPRTFEYAGNILQDSFQHDYDWIIIDEIGRLELNRNKGLEPYFSDFLQQFKQQHSKTKLLLVIRDYLLQEAISFYGLTSAKVIPKHVFEQSIKQEIVSGLVLCGGQSVRMGRDKAFIEYHHKDQYAFVADMMKVFCKDVFVSCKKSQLQLISKQYSTLTDNATFDNAGPLTGLLSAFNQPNTSGFLVMGCDYPFFNLNDMKALFAARVPGIDVVCYHNTETKFDEPLLAIYEKTCASRLIEFYKNGNTSLTSFLKTVNTKRINPIYVKSIQSIDSPNQELHI